MLASRDDINNLSLVGAGLFHRYNFTYVKQHKATWRGKSPLILLYLPTEDFSVYVIKFFPILFKLKNGEHNVGTSFY